MDRAVTVEISHLVLFCFLYYTARFHERENIFNNDYAFYYHASALFSAVIGLTVHPSVTLLSYNHVVFIFHQMVVQRLVSPK